MKRNIKILSLLVTFALLLTMSCGGDSDDGSQGETDTFDREGMLANWADNLIVPGYDNYFVAINNLREVKDRFLSTESMADFQSLRERWKRAYESWQVVSMFEIGPAETLSLRNFTNVFPTDTQEIEDHIASGNANLELPSTNDAQGFPALDYLFYGIADNDEAIMAKLLQNDYRTYMSLLVERLWTMADEVRRGWRVDNYRDTFVSASGSDATSSVNKMVNDYMFYYEKALRAGKVGIPAGVFSGSPLSDRVEAPYNGTISKELLLIALNAADAFFRGGVPGMSIEVSLQAYLDELNVRKGDTLLSIVINSQFAAANGAIQALNDDLKTQVETDNSKMLAAYDELQKLVVLLKVDMFQALNIQVDFVDADGD